MPRWNFSLADSGTGNPKLNHRDGYYYVPRTFKQVLVDSFEDTDFSEYPNQGDNGNTSLTQVTTKSTESAASNEYWVQYEGAYRYSMPGDGLSYYPEIGDRIYADLMFPDDADNTQKCQFLFGVQGVGDYYALHMTIDDYFGTYNFELIEYKGGNSTQLAHIGTSLNRLTWYRLFVDWEPTGNYRIRLTEVNGSLSVETELSEELSDVPNPTFTDGGVGFRIYEGSDGYCWWDRIMVDQAQ